MLRRFVCSHTRYFDVLEDDFGFDFYAKSPRDALLLVVADFTGVYGKDVKEAKAKAKRWLDRQLGKSWTVDDFFNANLELWQDSVTCFRVNDLFQVS